MMQIVLMIGIAGTDKDFLLSLPVLKSYMMQFEEVKKLYDFIIIDFKPNDTVENILKYISDYRFDILCLSSYIWNKERVGKLLHSNICSNIIIGGPDIPNNITPLNSSYKINVVYGQGERKLFKLLMGYESPLNDDMNYPSPYQYVDTNILHEKGMRINIETSRGCNYKCGYCNYGKSISKIVYRDIDKVIEDMIFLNENGIKEGRINDSNFFSNHKRTETLLCKMIENNIKIKFSMEIIPAFITKDLIELSRQYIENGGDILFGVGIQSINPVVIKAANRPFDKNLDRNLSNIISTKAMLRIDLILGLPLDTKDSYIKSVEYVCELCKYNRIFVNFSILHLIPNTTFNNNKNLGLVVDEDKVVSTPDFSAEDISYCKLINVVVFRLFDPLESDSKKFGIRKAFFKRKDLLNCRYIYLIDQLILYIKKKLYNTDSPFVKGMKDPLAYYHRKISEELSYEWIINTINNIK